MGWLQPTALNPTKQLRLKEVHFQLRRVEARPLSRLEDQLVKRLCWALNLYLEGYLQDSTAEYTVLHLKRYYAIEMRRV